MEKKKKVWALLAVMVAVVLSMSLTACGDDDDDPIVGLWVTNDASRYAWLIKSNGTYQYGYASAYDDKDYDFYEHGKYTLKGSKIYISDSDDPDNVTVYKYVISDNGKTMFVTSVSGDSYFTGTYIRK